MTPPETPGVARLPLNACNQNGCGLPPVARYTWPGKNEAGICGAHVVSLRNIAAAMGLPLQIIPLLDDGDGT
jgi:hypothetical protein